MIVSKAQKQPKLNKVVIVAPQASAAKTAALPKVCVHIQVRERAFEIFEKRGSRHGHDQQDWFRAERQILAH
jgi:hypothetical protein